MDATELTWADQVYREGREEGLREAIYRLVRARFGRMAPELEARVAAITREEDLAAFVEQVGKARSEADLLAS